MAAAAASSGKLAPCLPLYSFGVPWPEYNDGLYYTDVVRDAAPGLTLIEFYTSKYRSSAPLQGWLHRISNGQITVDGEVARAPDTVLRIGSKVIYHRLPWKEPFAPYILNILYEDNDMVAIYKPSGLQVLPGGVFQQRTVLNQLRWKPWNKNSSSHCSSCHTAEELHPVPVHRLGRGTSGILLCAKTQHAKTTLAAYFSDGTSVIGKKACRKIETLPLLASQRKILKFYRALVVGIIKDDEIVIDQSIGVMHYPGVAKGLYAATLSGKPASSKVHVLERDFQENKTLVQVEIYSGRPHQIRIHLAFIGHPLLGDPLYTVDGIPNFVEAECLNENIAEDGGYNKPTRPVPGDCGYYLHAHRLVVYHPSTSEVIEIISPPPPILQTHEERDVESCSRPADEKDK